MYANGTLSAESEPRPVHTQLIAQYTGRQHGIGLGAEAYSLKTEQEGIDARRFFDPCPIRRSAQGAFT